MMLLLMLMRNLLLPAVLAQEERRKSLHPEEGYIAVGFDNLSEDLYAPFLALYTFLKKILGTFKKIVRSFCVVVVKPL
jgi:hypothetical protein